MRKKHWMLSPWFIIFAAVMLLMTTISANYNMAVFYTELGVTIAATAVVFVLSLRFSAYIRGIVKSTADRIDGVDREYLERYKYPVAVVGPEGDIAWCNARFRKAIGGRSPEGDHINNYISGYDYGDIIDSDGIDVAVDGREFTVYCMSADNAAVCHFGDMNESVFVYSQIYECAKSTDIRHNARQHHACLQIIYRVYVLVKMKLLRFAARITSGLRQLFQNICQGRKSHFCGHVFVQINLIAQFFLGNQIRDGAFLVFRHLLHDSVTLRVYGTVIQRISSFQPQESSCLFKSLSTEFCSALTSVPNRICTSRGVCSRY